VIADRLARAHAQLEALAAEERGVADLDPANASRWWIGEGVADVAVVLLHGFTNNPRQYAQLAPLLAARGHAVIVPRVRYHGYRDRLTDAIEALTASDWEEAALRAIAIAALCGRRVVVAGISVAGTLCGWLASRVAVDHTIAIAPFCGIRELPGGANGVFGGALRTLPNRFFWWDPRRHEGQLPLHAYPRFSTHALGQSLLLADELVPGEPGDAATRRVTMLFNDAEPIVNNAYAERRFAVLRECGVQLVRETIHVANTHDIIEPQIPQARPDVVYPRLIALIES